MKMNRHRTLKLIGSMLLTVAMAVTMIGYLPQTAMAAGGNATVTLAKAEGLDANTEFSFEMYKVGHFDGPGLVLEDNLKDSKADVDFPADSDENDSAKSKRMVKSASQLAKYIDDNGISLKAVGTHTLKPGESFTQAVTENGLYLVRSNTVRDASGANYNWTPQPVYVMVLNGDSSVTISNDVVVKILRTPVQLKHRVVKTWVIPNAAGERLRYVPLPPILMEAPFLPIVALTPFFEKLIRRKLPSFIDLLNLTPITNTSLKLL